MLTPLSILSLDQGKIYVAEPIHSDDEADANRAPGIERGPVTADAAAFRSGLLDFVMNLFARPQQARR